MDLIWWIVILAFCILPAIAWGLWYTFRGAARSDDAGVDTAVEADKQPE